MIATVMAWTIFVLNSAAGQPMQPYFIPGETETREYASQELCMAAIRDIYERQRKNKELFCHEYSRQIETDMVHDVEPKRVVKDAPVLTPAETSPAKQPPSFVNESLEPAAKQNETETVLKYRIGRFDDQQVFHGTAYDSTLYATMGNCEVAFKKAKVKVMGRILQQGGDDIQAGEALADFKAKYACQELHLDPSEVSPTPAVEPTQQLPTPPASYQMTTVEGLPTTQALIMPGQPSFKSYRMAELSRAVYGIPQWIFYAPVFATPAQCWAAVSDFITGEQREAQDQFQSMAQNYGAAQWYQNKMTVIEQHRRQLQCVVH